MIEVQHVNREVMIDAAWRHVFGRAIEAQERAVLRAVIIQHFHNHEAPASELTANVSLITNVTKPTAKKMIDRATDQRLIEFRRDQQNETRKLYRLGPGIRSKLAEVGRLTSQIDRVIEAQLANPKDLHAGRDLLDAPIYFNIAIPEYKAMHNQRISERKAQFKDAPVKGKLKNAA